MMKNFSEPASPETPTNTPPSSNKKLEEDELNFV